MKTIYKYPLQITNQQHVAMPEGAVMLHADLDPGGELCLWALVNPTNDLTTREVLIFGTGAPCDAEREDYFRTVVCGAFVWHIFVEKHYFP